MTIKGDTFERFYLEIFDLFESKEWTKRKPKIGVLNADVWFALDEDDGLKFPRYFKGDNGGSGPKYFYDRYRKLQKERKEREARKDYSEITIEIDDRAYFKGLLYIGIGLKLKPALDFSQLLEADKLDSTFSSANVRLLHSIYENPSTQFSESDDKEMNRILDSIDDIIPMFDGGNDENSNVESLLLSTTQELNQKDKERLYKYIFDFSNPTRRRVCAIYALSVSQTLSNDEIISLLMCPTVEIKLAAFSRVFSLISIDSAIPDVIYTTMEMLQLQRDYSTLLEKLPYYLITGNLTKGYLFLIELAEIHLEYEAVFSKKLNNETSDLILGALSEQLLKRPDAPFVKYKASILHFITSTYFKLCDPAQGIDHLNKIKSALSRSSYTEKYHDWLARTSRFLQDGYKLELSGC